MIVILEFGLFGSVGGTVKNINVTNAYIMALWNVGGIVGFSNRDEYISQAISQEFTNEQEHITCTEVENCSFSGAIIGSGNMGGIIGAGCGHVRNCVNYGTLYGKLSSEWRAFQLNGNSIGGLIGDYAAVIVDSRNEGNIIANGTNYTENNGTSIGGLAGNASGLEISNSYNLGSIKGKEYVGGIAGSAYIDISNSYNKGSILGNSIVGGITGWNLKTISDSYNTGIVNGNNEVGGIVGVNDLWYTDIKIENCYNIGNVKGKQNVGAILGIDDRPDDSPIQKYRTTKNCYYLKDASVNINNSINGIGNEVDSANSTTARLKEFFPIYLKSDADASFNKLGYPKYTVTFKNADGTVLSSQQVEYGGNAIAPETPTKEGYLFAGWNVEFTNIKSDLTVTATYKEKPKYVVGDINNDGKVNTLDAVKILQYVAKKTTLNETQMLAANTNRDNKVNTLDAVKILQYVAKKITKL